MGKPAKGKGGKKTGVAKKTQVIVNLPKPGKGGFKKPVNKPGKGNGMVKSKYKPAPPVFVKKGKVQAVTISPKKVPFKKMPLKKMPFKTVQGKLQKAGKDI